MNIAKIYEYALQREIEGRDFFLQHARRFGHAAVVGTFQRLAAEEEQHIAFIQGLIQGLDQEHPVSTDPEAGEPEGGAFAQRASSEMLDQTVIESMVPDLAVLRMAYLIEQDLAGFYESAAARAQDETAARSLGMLAQWERGHEKLFKSLHDRAFEEYAGMPWGG